MEVVVGVAYAPRSSPSFAISSSSMQPLLSVSISENRCDTKPGVRSAARASPWSMSRAVEALLSFFSVMLFSAAASFAFVCIGKLPTAIFKSSFEAAAMRRVMSSNEAAAPILLQLLHSFLEVCCALRLSPKLPVDPSQPATERADSDALDRDIFTRGTTRAEYAVLVPKANGTPRSRTASSSDSVAERSHLGKMGVCSSASMPPPLPDDAPNHPVAEAMTTRCTQ